MTFLLRWVFSLLRLLCSETRTLPMVFGLLLGMFWGLAPVLSLQSLLICIALFVFRVQLGTAFISAFFFKLLFLILWPLFHLLGDIFLSWPFLEPLWTSWYHKPLIPYTRFNSSVVMGAGLFCFLFSVPAFYGFKWFIERYRERALAFMRNSSWGIFIRETALYKRYLKYPSQIKSKSFGSPLRFGAFKALTLLFGVFLLFFVYIHFFLDVHLRWVVEKMGTYLVGAEVRVEHLHTRFLQSSLKLQSFAITNPYRLTHYWVEFQELHLRFSWEGLLRGKALIPLWEVKGLAFNRLRSKPGKKASSSWVSLGGAGQGVQGQGPEQKQKSGQGVQGQGRPLEKALSLQGVQREQGDGDTSLEDVFSFLKGGEGDVLESLSSRLTAGKKIQKLEKDILHLHRKWDRRIQNLPEEGELKKLYEEVRAIDFSNLLKLPEALSKLEKILKKGKKKYDLIKGAEQDLQRDLRSIRKNLSQASQWVEEDLKILREGWKPFQGTTRLLSREMLRAWLRPYREKWGPYYQKLQPYLPGSLSSSSGFLRVYSTHRGNLYEFGSSAKSYPLLWIQTLKLGGDRKDPFRGEVRHLSSNFRALGKPLTLSFKGEDLGADFPLEGFHVSMAFKPPPKGDPRGEGEVYDGKGSLSLSQWQMGEHFLFSTPDLKLGWKRATSQLQMDFTFLDSVWNLQGKQTFKSLEYDVQTKDPLLKDFLFSLLQSLPELYIHFQVKGEVENPQLSVNSNLGDALEKALVKKVQKRLKEKERQLKQQMEKEMTQSQKQIDQSLKSLRGSYGEKVRLLRRHWDTFLKENSGKLGL